MDQESPHKIGQIIGGRYTIQGVLGVGGMGFVYSALAQNGVTVALKVLHPNLTTNNVAVSRFMIEAETIYRLSHPNIVEVYDYGRSDDDTLFIAMEILAGVTIVDAIQERGAIDIKEARRIILETTQALAAAHNAGVVHRDLKPENIMLVRNEKGFENIKVLDFGLAIVLEENRIQMERQRLTQADVVMGTPGYMSPEQIHGFDVDARTDLYSLGVIWWEMLTGRQLFSGRSAVEVMMRHIKEEPPHPKAANPKLELPEIEYQLLTALLKKDKEERPESGQIVLNHLVDIVKGVESPALLSLRASQRHSLANSDAESFSSYHQSGGQDLIVVPSGESIFPAEKDASLFQPANNEDVSLELDNDVMDEVFNSHKESTRTSVFEKLWMVKQFDQMQPPISKAELLNWVREGRLRTQDLVAQEGEVYRAAYSYPFLKRAFGRRTVEVTGLHEIKKGSDSKPIAQSAYTAKAASGSFTKIIFLVCALLCMALAGVYFFKPELIPSSILAKLASKTADSVEKNTLNNVKSSVLLENLKKKWRGQDIKIITNLDEYKEWSEILKYYQEYFLTKQTKIDRRLQQLIVSGAQKPEIFALLLINRSHMPDARFRLKECEADSLLAELLIKYPKSSELAYAHAQLLKLSSNRKEAFKTLSKVRSQGELLLHEDFDFALMHLPADTLSAQNIFDSLKMKTPAVEGLVWLEARIKRSQGQFKKVIALLESWLKSHPNDIESRYYLVEAMAKVLRTENAKNHLNMLRKAFDTNIYADYLRLKFIKLLIYQYKNKKGLLRLFKPLLDRNKEYYSNATMILYAFYLLNCENNDVSAEILDMLKVKNPNSFIPYGISVLLSLQEKNVSSRALAEMQSILLDDVPQKNRYLFQQLRADSFLHGAKKQEAVEYYRKVLELNSLWLLPYVSIAQVIGEVNEDALLARDPLWEYKHQKLSELIDEFSQKYHKEYIKKSKGGVNKELSEVLTRQMHGDWRGAQMLWNKLRRKKSHNELYKIYSAAHLLLKNKAKAALKLLKTVADSQNTIGYLFVEIRAKIDLDDLAVEKQILDLQQLINQKISNVGVQRRLLGSVDYLLALTAKKKGNRIEYYRYLELAFQRDSTNLEVIKALNES